MAVVVSLFFALLVAFVCTFSTCFAIKPDQPTKQFIQVVLENQNKEGSPISIGPFRAIPQGQHIRARLGVCAEAFLVPDVMLWDPLSYFPELFLFCPSCDEQGKREYLHPIRWKDGSTVYDQPQLLYGLRSDVLLAGRVYLCKNKHQILSHDPCILSQVRDEFQPPFVLFYRVGVTRELFQFFTSHIRVGMTIADVQVLWHQSLFDDYGLRKLCFLRESQQQSEFPSFLPKGKKTGEKIATACFIQDYFAKEHLYSRRMCWLSADHTFKVSANIGLWCNGKWIQLYDSIFIVMNEVGVVLSWRLCKGTSFNEVEDLLQQLKDRLGRQGCCISHFFVDNCCHWRAKLNSIFDSSLVLLDPFHGIQRVTSKIPRKGTKGSPLRKLRYNVMTDFKLVLRDPTDWEKKS